MIDNGGPAIHGISEVDSSSNGIGNGLIQCGRSSTRGWLRCCVGLIPRSQRDFAPRTMVLDMTSRGAVASSTAHRADLS